MTEDEVIERTVRIMRDLHDLKEDVLFGGGVQPQFDAGMLEAALVILRANVDDEDPRVMAETARECNARVLRAIGEPPSSSVAVDPAGGLGQEGLRATESSSLETPNLAARAVPREPLDAKADVVCKHGVAMNVHCCGCHSGFLFDSAACTCLSEHDEELTPHPFNSRAGAQYEPGDDRDIWCKDCEYHRDHAIHRAVLREPDPPDYLVRQDVLRCIADAGAIGVDQTALEMVAALPRYHALTVRPVPPEPNAQ